VVMHGGMMITLLPHLIDRGSQECGFLAQISVCLRFYPSI
jgi:hypothetical protein